MGRFCHVFGFMLMASFAAAQQRPIQSLYMFDPLLVNPAYAGSAVQLSATAVYRNQWVNLEGAPKTATLTMHSGFRKLRVGVGIIANTDKIGIHEDFGFYGVYSYRLPLTSNSSVIFGLQGGFNNLVSNYNLLNNKYAGDPNLTGVNRSFNPNFGAGLFYRHEKLYLGVSVPYILNNDIVDLENVTSIAQQRRYFYIMAGTTKALTPVLDFLPSTLVRIQQEAPLSFDVNATFVLYKMVGLGVSWRFKDAVVALFELQINDNFHVGYAYDMTTSELNQYSNGTHEIMLNYRIRINRIHKGLECPAYW